MEYLQADIADALHEKPKKRANIFHTVRTSNAEFPVLDVWREGFSVAETDAPHLRGHVEIWRGDTRVARCLIVLASAEHGVATYEFKQRTDGGAPGPVDYAREHNAPIALLT